MFLVTPNQLEIINVNHIVAVKTMHAIKKILIYTESTVIAVRTLTQDELESYEEQIEIAVHSASPRWVKCQNWLFRADKIVQVTTNNDGLSVHVADEKAFKVIRTGTTTNEELMTELVKSLSRPLLSDKGPSLIYIK